jgi:hypothetical protein
LVNPKNITIELKKETYLLSVVVNLPLRISKINFVIIGEKNGVRNQNWKVFYEVCNFVVA